MKVFRIKNDLFFRICR